MNAYLVAIHLLVQAHENPHGEIAAALHDVLTGDMRKFAGDQSALIDWAIAGDDIASSIAPVLLPADYTPDVSAFPVWPGSGAL